MLNNKTTFELNLSATKTPFKQATVVKNMQMVLGHAKVQWLSPFHDPFPDIKQSGIGSDGPSQRHITSLNNLVGGNSSVGIEYIQCIIPTVR